MKKIRIACCILPVLVCLGLIALWAAPNILPRSTRSQDIALSDLLIDTNPFPPGWQVSGKAYKNTEEDFTWGEDNLGVKFSRQPGPGYAYHYIYRFRNPLSAVYGQFWIKQHGILFSKSGTHPKDWSYQGKNTDDVQISCMEHFCSVMARYGEFVSILETHISPEVMTLNDLAKIQQAIDDQIATKINR